MSTLTKLFVVLLVVCSLLLTASTVVFVARSDNFKQQAEAQQNQLAKVTQERDSALGQVGGLQSQLQQLSTETNARATALSQKIADLDKQLGDQTATVAKTDKEKSIMQVSLQTAEANVKAAQELIGQFRNELASLRKENDGLTQKNSDLNALSTDLEKKLDATERDRRYLSEQVTEIRANMAKAEATLKNHGLTEVADVAKPINDQPINGVIREVQVINQIPYATISVGSSDNVQKGMQFKVVNVGTGEFFGVLTVDGVEANQAIGRLEGPKVQDIKPGLEVRTQL